MKFPAPANNNYAAVIVRIPAILTLENSDNLIGIPLPGAQAVTQKGWEEGDLVVMFPTESQLSDEYTRENNLYRDSDRNADKTEAGYFETNRRVKAIKLRGHRSDALVMPLSSLDYTGVNIGQLNEGDTFDRIGDHEICRKYELPVKAQPGDGRQAKITKKFKRVDAKFLPEHISTDNYWHHSHHIPADADLIVTQKLHGTSVRVGNTIVRHKPRLRDKIARFFGVRVEAQGYDNVYGSRKVIKDPNADQNHFYGEDIWTVEGAKLEGLVPKGFVVYGELVGFTSNGAAIQKNYTYDAAPNEAKLYVYRVAYVNPEGMVTDLSWDQVVEFCRNRGLKTVPELWRGKHEDFDANGWMDDVYANYFDHAVPLSHKKTVDEGVCVRVEGLLPRIYKAKSAAFLRHETKLLDEGEVDLESAGSVE
ncbi:hypothetical protein GS982_01650 [Rhodococcus hoagii]|uniref:RNA ligase domain-containing protein n=1 Tax=Rhodococcus hoagii TaxID=43767 RepID=A0A9Q4ZIS1_RHOHA|nr:hypothetical protein [Prescottella equi]NKT77302.1 hypothetical protein [Prescottella equi]NKZ81089.1 hypothetical protein [Prescottella equi]